ncbi:hypothetical protein QBC46DRAFT_400707 [Diplogelasinospora grovesii]|uniref:Uncharacterized protein n=1 Tax=Diplogelasinospora grovesii TaxID=303347 RepID=A0AAN6RYQ9_9PEZI|nr:hypothetical protein QBC46DRAFT_400707 [Diplogelasinospora grovesii]
MLNNHESWMVIYPAYVTFTRFRAGIQSAENPDSPAYYSLCFALHATRIFCATDPRDKIYGVLGLTRPDIQQRIAADYAKSVEDVFREAVLHILLKEASPAFYGYLPLNRSVRPGLQSWVPDFTSPQAARYMGLPPILNPDEDLKHDVAGLRVSVCRKRLMVKGRVLNVVKAIRPPTRHAMVVAEVDGRSREVLDAIREWLRRQGLVDGALPE